MPKFAFFLLLLCCAPVVTASNRVVHHALGDWSPEIRRYQMALLKAGLRASEKKYGPVQIEFMGSSMTPSRWRMFFVEGKIQSTMVSAQQLSVEQGRSNAVFLPFPVLNLQLGLRHLVVHKDMLPRFENVKRLSDLKVFRPGQGSHWPEVAIYRGSGIDVQVSEQFGSLFGMLERKRFDYIPLSVLESKAALAVYRDKYPDLAIVEGLYVFYPLPVYLAVSTADKEAVSRLEYAVDWLLTDRRYLKIYIDVFGDEGEVLDEDAVVIALSNPLYPKPVNDELTRQFFSGPEKFSLPAAPIFNQ